MDSILACLSKLICINGGICVSRRRQRFVCRNSDFRQGCRDKEDEEGNRIIISEITWRFVCRGICLCGAVKAIFRTSRNESKIMILDYKK